MKAPSKDLLRALRRATSPNSSHHYHSQIPVHYDRLPSPSQRAPSHPQARPFTTSLSHPAPPPPFSKSRAPKTHDRGPTSQETTQTDFSAMDIFNTASVQTPATAIDACTPDGFHLNNGTKTSGGAGILLVGGEAFTWRPWDTSTAAGSAPSAASLLSGTGVLSLPPQSLSVLALLYPKPDLLLVGTGAKLWMLAKETRDYLGGLGIRVDVMDTANATAAYNLLATERGVEGGSGVGGAFLPLGWRGLPERKR